MSDETLRNEGRYTQEALVDGINAFEGEAEKANRLTGLGRHKSAEAAAVRAVNILGQVVKDGQELSSIEDQLL